MATYRVCFPKRDDVIEEELKKYPKCKPSLINDYYFGIDDLITIILAFECSGVMLRDDLEEHYRDKNFGYAEELGKKVWDSGYLALIPHCNRILKETEPTISKGLAYDIGVALIKCYRVAVKFDICSARRNDDRYRYWCTFTMPSESFYFFEDIVFKEYFSKSQITPAIKNFGINNFVYMLSKWDEYVNIPIDEIKNLDNYIMHRVKSKDIFYKLNSADKYLRLFGRMITSSVREMEVVNGQRRRVTKLIPMELYIDKMVELKKLAEECDEAANFLTDITSIREYIDEDTFNFSTIRNVAWSLRDIFSQYKSIEHIIFTLSSNFCGKYSNDLKHISSGYHLRYEHEREEWNKLFSDSAKYNSMLNGWYCIGYRINRLPRMEDDRKRIFI